MKTYKQFIFDSYNALKDRDDIQELAPLAAIPAALKLGGAALSAYSAYQTAKKLKKGDYKGAGIEALGMIPAGGIASKGVSKIPAVANLINKGNKAQRFAGKTIKATTGFAADSARLELPTERNKVINKGIDKGIEMTTNAVLGTGAAQAKNSSTPVNSNTSQSSNSSTTQSTAKKKEIDPKKLPGAGLEIRTDLSSPTMRTKSQAEAEQGIEKDKPASTNVNTSAAQADAQAKQRREAEAKKKAEQALKKKNQELNDKLRPDFAMAG